MSDEQDFYRVVGAVVELQYALGRITRRCSPYLIEIKVHPATLDAIKTKARSAAPYPESAAYIQGDRVELHGVMVTSATTG